MNSFNEKNDLHPWGVISSFLFELPSDEVCRIIGLTGLPVDWNLTREEAYSHTTRKRAYLPRVQASFETLSEDKKLIVAWIIISELVKKDTESISQLNSQLALIGWKVESDRLTPVDINVREIFFPKGTQHDAYIEIKEIIQKTKSQISIIDPYIDSTIFRILSTILAKEIVVQLLSFKLPPDFSHERQKFVSQHLNFTIEVRTTVEFHDRFIIIDGEECYHIGASIKDAGNKAFMISQIEDKKNIESLIKQQLQSWNSATKSNN